MVGIVCAVTIWLLFGFFMGMTGRSRDGGQWTAQDYITAPSPVHRTSRDRSRWRWMVNRRFIMTLTVVLLFIWVPIAERNLWTLPTEVGPDAVGQWGPVVAVVLVTGAAWVKGQVDKRNVEGEERVDARGVEEGRVAGWGQVNGMVPAKVQMARVEVGKPFG